MIYLEDGGAPARRRCRALVVALMMAASVPAFAQSTAQAGAWQYSGSVYGYLPSIGGKTIFPVPAGGSSVDISTEQILDSLDFAFMGTFRAHNGRWGAFTDVIYLSASADKAASRDFTIGGTSIDAGTSASLGLEVKGFVWTLAGEYRVVSNPGMSVDLIGGTRLFSMKQELRYSIAGNLGPLAAPGRSGTVEVKSSLWDVVVGAKGRVALGAGSRWSAPFYLDLGAGESKLSWQAAAGVSYAYRWGDVSALWRYLDYDMKAGQAIQSFNFNGPMVGATFRW